MSDVTRSNDTIFSFNDYLVVLLETINSCVCVCLSKFMLQKLKNKVS